MKITVDPKLLADAVGWASRALAQRPSMPVLAGLLLEADADGLTVSAFDYDVTMQARLAAAVAEPGRVLVPGKVLAEVAKNLPTTSFADIVLSGAEVVVTGGRAEYALLTMPVSDYPTLPDAPPPIGTVDAPALRSALAQVVPAVSKDESTPFLACVQLAVTGDGLEVTATDRYRIARRVVDWQPAAEPAVARLLVFGRVMSEVARGLGAGQVQICGDARQAGFVSDGRQVVVRQVDENFPRCAELIAAANEPIKARVHAADLAGAVRSVAVMAERNTPVRLAFRGDTVEVRAGAGDIGRGSETLPCELDGPGMDGAGIEIAFMPQYLAEGLSAVEGEWATIGMERPEKRALVYGEDPSFRYLVQPLRAS